MTSKWCGKCGGEIVEGFCSTCHYNYTRWSQGWEVDQYVVPYLRTPLAGLPSIKPDKMESEGGYEPYWL